VTTKKIDLPKFRKELERMHKPGAGYPINKPPADPIVKAVDERAKKLKRHPAQR